MTSAKGTHSVSVLEVDAEPEGTAGKGLARNERVRERSLVSGLHEPLVSESGEVLDVEVEVHRVAERSVQCLQGHLLAALVQETDQELDQVPTGQFCNSDMCRVKYENASSREL